MANSRRSRTRLSCVSFRTTTGHRLLGQAFLARRLSTPLKRSSVARSAKVRITVSIITASVIVASPSYTPWDETGSDYLVYCLEQQIDPSVRSTYFGGKMAIMYRESAIEPASWCRGKVRRLWKWNYAGEIDTVALCP